MLLDLFIILLLVIAFLVGFSKGFIKILIGFIGILVAIYVAINYSNYFVNFFIETFHLSVIFSKFFSFILIFITIFLIFKILIFILDSLLSKSELSLLNKLIGGIINVLKIFIVVSVILTFIYDINKKHELFDNKVFVNSFFSNIIISVGHKVMNFKTPDNIKKENTKKEVDNNII